MKIRLPRSSEGKQFCYAILIRRILAHRQLGDTFDGRRYRPGARIDEEELRPTAEHPEVPLCLEYVGSDRSGRGHRPRSQHFYILWSYDRQSQKWKELARSSGEALEWIDTLRSVALSHLRLQADFLKKAAASATARVLDRLDEELDLLPTQERLQCLGLLYEQLNARIVRDDERI